MGDVLCRGAGYTFGSGVVRKFLEINNMNHILRAHQLCMEGFSVLFENRLSTVWSAPNYCYRCGNSASILEIGPGESVHFNVFEAAPENQIDGPSHQPLPTAPFKVTRTVILVFNCPRLIPTFVNVNSDARILPVAIHTNDRSYIPCNAYTLGTLGIWEFVKRAPASIVTGYVRGDTRTT
jgi:hypothetical protein